MPGTEVVYHTEEPPKELFRSSAITVHTQALETFADPTVGSDL